MQRVAAAFCERYGLSDAVMQPLLQHIQENLEKAKEETAEVCMSRPGHWHKLRLSCRDLHGSLMPVSATSRWGALGLQLQPQVYIQGPYYHRPQQS